MSQRRVTITSGSSVRARPAALFCRTAAASGPSVAREGENAIAASRILLALSPGVRDGEEVVLEADGLESESVLDELAALLATDLETPRRG